MRKRANKKYPHEKKVAMYRRVAGVGLGTRIGGKNEAANPGCESPLDTNPLRGLLKLKQNLICQETNRENGKTSFNRVLAKERRTHPRE